MRDLFTVINFKRDYALFLLAYRVHRLKGSLSGIYPLQLDDSRLLRAYGRLTLLLHLQPWGAHRPAHVVVRLQTYGEQTGLPPEKRKFRSLKPNMATTDSVGSFKKAVLHTTFEGQGDRVHASGATHPDDVGD